MQAAGKKLTSWLHKDAVTLPSELIYQQSDGSQQIAAASSSGALDTVADFWYTIWIAMLLAMLWMKMFRSTAFCMRP